MNYNKLWITLLAAAVTAGAQAKVLTPDEALQRAAGNSGMQKAIGKSVSDSRLMYTLRAEDQPALYVFDKSSENTGYIVLSADDLAYPVLGYADKGDFDPDNMPEAMKWWLQQYADQIAYARKNAGKPVMTTAKDDNREPIAPQIKTEWDQVEPYNNQCPSYSGIRTYTGCVATAIAQVMKYWEYPERGKGTISYTASTIQKRLSMNFAAKAFDWGNMLMRYDEGKYTDEQAAAVAYLMKACGYAVKMDYGTDSSGALAMNIANALEKYFSYDGNIDYQLRQLYSSTEWADMMYENLRDVGPVIYGGGSMIGGGHSFICDGYSQDGYFHFNWGWTGMSDGYFKLEGLNPYALGSGGGSGGGYNFTQDAVFGIQPPTGKPVVDKPEVLTQCGSLAGYIEDNILNFDLFAEASPMWVNYNPTTLKLNFGVRIEPQGDTQGEVLYAPISSINFTLEPGYGTGPSMFNPQLDLDDVNLPDGTYRLTIVTKDTETEDAQWQDINVNYACSKYITLTRKGSEYKVTNQDVSRLVITAASVKGNKFTYGCSHRFTIQITNDNDIELTSGFAPVIFCDGTAVMLGESIFVSLKPGETIERTWDTDLYLLTQGFSVSQDTSVKLSFFDEATYNIYSDDIMKGYVMSPNPGAPSLECTGVTLLGHTPTDETVNGSTVSIYNLEDETEVEVMTGIQLNSGFCAYNIYACLTSTEVDENSNVAILNSVGHPMYIETSGGMPAIFDAKMDISSTEPGKIYAIQMAIDYSQNLYSINGNPAFLRRITAGVDNIAADTADNLVRKGDILTAAGNADIQLYDMSGALVAAGNGELDLTPLAHGLYIARANGVSLKIAR